VEFFRRVSDGYRARMAADPARFVAVDAAQERAAVWRQIQDALAGRGL
jgi:dTMP kinase